MPGGVNKAKSASWFDLPTVIHCLIYVILDVFDFDFELFLFLPFPIPLDIGWYFSLVSILLGIVGGSLPF